MLGQCAAPCSCSARSLAWPAAASAAARPSLRADADPEGAEGDDLPAQDRVRRPPQPRRPGCARPADAGPTLVADGRVRGDGSFRIPVELGSPGPFHVALAERPLERSHGPHPPAARREARRQPRSPARRSASPRRSSPPAAGRVRVQVIRGGAVGFDQQLPRRRARSALGTREVGTVRVRSDDRCRAPGYDRLRRELPATLRATEPLRRDDRARPSPSSPAASPRSTTRSPRSRRRSATTSSAERLRLPEGAGARAHGRGRRGLLEQPREPADPAGRATASRRTTSRSTRPARCSTSSAAARSR